MSREIVSVGGEGGCVCAREREKGQPHMHTFYSSACFLLRNAM